jgi:hypothetical protein
MIYSHGNAEDIIQLEPWIRQLSKILNVRNLLDRPCDSCSRLHNEQTEQLFQFFYPIIIPL